MPIFAYNALNKSRRLGPFPKKRHICCLQTALIPMFQTQLSWENTKWSSMALSGKTGCKTCNLNVVRYFKIHLRCVLHQRYPTIQLSVTLQTAQISRFRPNGLTSLFLVSCAALSTKFSKGYCYIAVSPKCSNVNLSF